MVTSSEAEATLKTIRSLMERATIYRAISAPTALVGGMLSLLTSGLFLAAGWTTFEHETCFLFSWLGVAATTATVNILLLYRDAKRRKDPFISPGMKLALRGMLPPFVVAVWLTGFMGYTQGGQFAGAMVILWMLMYGLALLSTQEFAPASITWLGWTFLIAGFATFTAMLNISLSIISFASIAMGCSFGLLHLIYAACTWKTTPASESVAAS